MPSAIRRGHQGYGTWKVPATLKSEYRCGVALAFCAQDLSSKTIFPSSCFEAPQAQHEGCTFSVCHSAAAGLGSAFGIDDLQSATILREAVGVFACQSQQESRRCGFNGNHRKLRDQSSFILHFHRQVIGTQHGFGHAQYAGQSTGRESVFNVCGNPNLQNTGGGRTGRPPAVDEVLLNAPDLRDMKMCRNKRTVRQHELQIQIRTCSQYAAKLIKLHVRFP